MGRLSCRWERTGPRAGSLASDCCTGHAQCHKPRQPGFQTKRQAGLDKEMALVEACGQGEELGNTAGAHWCVAVRPHEGAAASREQRAEGQLGGQGTGRYLHTGKWEIQSRVGRTSLGRRGGYKRRRQFIMSLSAPGRGGHLEDPEAVCQE